MLHRLLPRQIDNEYGGHKLALWILGAVVAMKGAIGLGTIFNGRSAAIGADGIPLATFTPAGQDAFVSLFAAWGLSQLILNLVGLVVLVRYRALAAFMFALLLLEHSARKLIFWVLPLPRDGTPPGLFINLGLVAAMLTGLVLSLRQARPETRA